MIVQTLFFFFLKQKLSLPLFIRSLLIRFPRNSHHAKSGRPVPSLTKYSQAIAYLLRGPKLTICSQLTDGSTLTAEADPPIPQKNNNFNPFPFSRSYEVKYTMWPGAHRPMLAWSLVQFGSAPSTPACRESYSFERKWLGGGTCGMCGMGRLRGGMEQVSSFL